MNLAIVSGFQLFRDSLENLISQKIKEAKIIRGYSSSDLYEESQVPADILLLGRSALSAKSDFYSVITGLKKTNSLIVFIEDQTIELQTISLPRLFQAGISGYLTAKSNSEELFACLKSISHGERYVNAEVLKGLLDSLAIGSELQYPNSIRPTRNLTKNEMQVATMLAEGRSVSSVANQTGRRTSTVSTIKKNIFRKTHSENIIMLRDFLMAKSDG